MTHLSKPEDKSSAKARCRVSSLGQTSLQPPSKTILTIEVILLDGDLVSGGGRSATVGVTLFMAGISVVVVVDVVVTRCCCLTVVVSIVVVGFGVVVATVVVVVFIVTGAIVVVLVVVVVVVVVVEVVGTSNLVLGRKIQNFFIFYQNYFNNNFVTCWYEQQSLLTLQLVAVVPLLSLGLALWLLCRGIEVALCWCW